MRLTFILTALTAVGWLAVPVPAAEPTPAGADVPEALRLLPESTIAFFYIPNADALEKDLARFADRTGWNLGPAASPVRDAIARRTGIHDGLAAEGGVCIGFVDPKRFRERYTIYVLPVADWETLLASAKAEMMSPGLYALTGTIGPRFVRRKGSYAVVTSSIRTMDAVSSEPSLAGALQKDTCQRVTGGAPVVYANIHRIKEIYEPEIASWFRAASGKVYDQPNALPYADMLVTYMLGIASLLDQMETIEASLDFQPEGLGADLAIRFVEGGPVAEFFSVQRPGIVPVPTVTDRPVASAVTLRIHPEKRTALALRATRFFLEQAPRPEPLPESTKATVAQAVGAFMESLGENVTFLSAPAEPGMGLEAHVSIYDLVQPDAFQKSVTLLVDAWERLADQLHLYLKFRVEPEPEEIEGIPVVVYRPRLRFGMPAQHVRFHRRLRELYGPEGMVYRVAVVGKKAVVATGSDLTLLRKVLAQLKSGQAPQPSPALRRLGTHLDRNQNIVVAMSLPVYLGGSLIRGGTPVEKIGTVDPGDELVGIGVRFNGTTARLSTYWPHEQIRRARELIARVAPEAERAPESLFAPDETAPPPAQPEAPGGTTPPEKAPASEGAAPPPAPVQPETPAPPVP